MTQPNRPLSPHLGVYRWQISNTLSILHRFSGLALTAGGVAFALWLVAIGSGPDSYLAMVALLGSPVGVVCLFGWTLCFFYHLCNGIRHLFWDAGYGFEIPRARASGLAVVGLALVLTVAFWLLALTGSGV